MTVNSLSNLIAAITPSTANSFVTGFTIKNVELVCESITLEASGMQQILAMFPGAFKLNLKVTHMVHHH